MAKKNGLVGLVPYQEEDQFVFFGREKEVENLLQIIQKNKLITLTGPSGSGKSSLINAGLIPRLKKGFLGQSGKEWAICRFRPGVSPIDNMIGALTTSGVFNKDRRSNTEDFLTYKKIIEEDRALSLSKIYSQSEINNNQNLLIIVDQLEDLFQFHHLESSKQGEDHLLFEIIARTARMKETSIYFLISLQTEYISGLSAFSSIQELFNKSQYAIQNFGAEGLKKCIRKNFTEQGVGFDSAAYHALLDPLANDLSILPNIQFLLYRLYHEKEELKSITIQTVKELGGVKNVISKKLEEVFQSLSAADQEDFSKVIRATMNFENPDINSDANYFKNIVEISGVDKANANRLILHFQNHFGACFDVIEEKISGIESKKSKRFLLSHMLSFKYQKNTNWQLEEVWKEKENSTFLNYTEYATLADKHSAGDIGLLSSPELELAIQWKENAWHDKNWAKKYNLNYSKTIDYISKSQEVFNRNREREEYQIRRKKRITKAVISTISVLTVVALIMAVGAIINKAKAEKNFEEANRAKELAVKKSIEAENARKKASESEQIALEEKKVAESARIIAQISLKKARIAQQKALQSALEAEEQKKLAEASEKVATEKQKEALIQQENANIAKDQAEKLRQIALLETEFYPLMLQLERLVEDNSFQASKRLIIATIEEALLKYYQYKDLIMQTNSGKIVTEGLFGLLQTALRILENKNTYSDTSMLIKNIKPISSIRSVSTFENNIIALGGDDQYLYILNGATKAEIPQIKINERIRKVEIANDKIIYVGTFEGNVYRIDLNANIARDRKRRIHKADSPIDELFFNADQNQLFIVSSKKVFRFENQNSSVVSENNQITASTYIPKIKAVILATDQGLVLNAGEKNNLINIREIDLTSEKITALSLAGNRLFVGTRLGQIYVYKINLLTDDRMSLSFNDKIILHRSEITKLFFDERNNNLYSASFDNQVLKYNIDFNDVGKITSSAISFIGHEKWVWDINLIKNAKGDDLIITADENGNLLSWFDTPEKLVAKVENLIKLKKQEN
ncbi:MAG: hypothetical protein ACPGVF_01120 [Flavobacteriaceae bacterium]